MTIFKVQAYFGRQVVEKSTGFIINYYKKSLILILKESTVGVCCRFGPTATNLHKFENLTIAVCQHVAERLQQHAVFIGEFV